MFPLLDLDDDAIVAALGFSDPRSLCLVTMACRRLRRLADAAWLDLDKHLEQNRREGGSTPRERVLSSFVVHSDKERISREVLTKRNGWEYVTPTELAYRDDLLHLQMYNFRLSYDSFIGSSVELRNPLRSANFPLQREHAKNKFDEAVSLFPWARAIGHRTSKNGHKAT